MATCTREEFVTRLEESGLLSDEVISRARDELRQAISENSENDAGKSASNGSAVAISVAQETTAAMKLARRFVKEGKLNRWQAQALLSGVSIKLGKYTLLEQIAAGEMGAVYRARHASLDREVAVKTLSRQYTNDSAAVSELREARAIAALDHRNLVHLFDICQDKDRYFLVLEHVLGADLQRLVGEQGPLPVIKVADVLRQAADGLACVHEAGLVHGHLEPADLIVEPQGTVKLVGLGASQLIDETHQPLAAPEVIAGAAPTASSDMFALGCVAWYMLTGKPAPANAQELPGLRPEAPAVLIELCRELLSLDSSRRPTSGEVSRRLAPWLREQIKEQKKDASSGSFPKVKKLPTAKALPVGDEPAAGESASPQAAASEPLATGAEPSAHPSGVFPSGLSISIVTANRPATGVAASPTSDLKDRAPRVDKSSPATPTVERAAVAASAIVKGVPVNRKLILVIAAVTAIVLLGGSAIVIGLFAFGRGEEAGDESASSERASQDTASNSTAEVSGWSEAEAIASDVAKPETPATSDPAQALPGEQPAAGEAMKSFAQALSARQAASSNDGAGDAPRLASAVAPMEPAVPPTTPPAATPPPTTEPAPAEQPAPVAPLAAEAPPPAATTPPDPAPASADPASPDPAAPGSLRDLPVAVDLPPIDAAADAPASVTWGAVHHGESDEYFAQLFGAESAVAKPGSSFYVKAGQGGASTREWEIFVRYGDDDIGRAIAKVQVAEQSLTFAWLPQAAKESPAVYLKNCVFHLRTTGAEHSIALRKPLIVPPLIVSFDKRAKAAHFEVPDAPRVEAIRIEIDTLEGEFGETRFDPAKEIAATKGETSLMLGPASEPLFGITIVSTVKRRFELSQEPFFHNKVGNLKTQIIPSKVKGRLAELVNDLQRLTFQKKQFDTVTEVGERARLQEQITNNEQLLALAETRYKQFEEFRTTAEKLNNAGKIHFRVYMPAGTAEVELARSSSDATPSGK